MSYVIQPFIIALTLLTRLPVGRLVSAEWSAKQYQHSVYCYPLVGALIGAFIYLLMMVLPTAVPAMLTAALVLTVWVGLTGALHLDGLADALDGYFAAHKDPSKALAVMRDPACGAMAVVGLIIVLLLKFTALVSLGSLAAVTVFVACILGRAAAMLVMNTTAYARENEDGIATDLVHPTATKMTLFLVIISCLVPLFILPLKIAVIVLALTAVLVWWWRRLWIKLINGFTGDCLGALIELTETLVLLILAIAMAA